MSEIDERIYDAYCQTCINDKKPLECMYCKMSDKGPSQYQPKLAKKKSTIKSYHDLLKDIEIYTLMIADLKNEHRKLIRAMDVTKPGEIKATDYSKERVQTSTLHIALDQIVDRVNEINTLLISLEDILNNKLITKSIIEQKISEYERLEYKVAYRRDIEGKSLIEIADELGYTYQYIKEISKKTKILLKTY